MERLSVKAVSLYIRQGALQFPIYLKCRHDITLMSGFIFLARLASSDPVMLGILTSGIMSEYFDTLFLKCSRATTGSVKLLKSQPHHLSESTTTLRMSGSPSSSMMRTAAAAVVNKELIGKSILKL
jgi:hypothetical protein